MRSRSLRRVARCASSLAAAACSSETRRAREPPVGLELALARAPRPDAAAEALEVLPHPAHAREVVLELRELDLELALGAPRVLREDVEDQLRAVDDARFERVLERSLLRRARARRRRAAPRPRCRRYAALQLRELALADERSRVGRARDAGRAPPTGSTPAVRASSCSSPSSSSPSDPFG